MPMYLFITIFEGTRQPPCLEYLELDFDNVCLRIDEQFPASTGFFTEYNFRTYFEEWAKTAREKEYILIKKDRGLIIKLGSS